MDLRIHSQNEKIHLRELAKKQLEYANLPVMRQRERDWFALHDGGDSRTMVVLEIHPFREELYPPYVCESPFGRWMEDRILCHLANYELVHDDKVVPNHFPVEMQIHIREHGFVRNVVHAPDGKGRTLGYAAVHPISDLRRDFSLIGPSLYGYDEKLTQDLMEASNDILGDILPVTLANDSLRWYMSFTARAVNLMGLQAFMLSMMDYPGETHALLNLILRDSLDYMTWQEREGLLTLNNHNSKVGAGSYGFTRQLPTDETKKTGLIGLKDLWGNMNSQESVGISPAMYEEFIFPVYRIASRLFGMIYYGCCEPVHAIWENCLSKLPNLKKVSVSNWCDEALMGEALAGTGLVYSRKPSPNFLGVGTFREDDFRSHIQFTMDAARHCRKEIIIRDVYTLDHDREKARRAIDIIRELSEGS